MPMRTLRGLVLTVLCGISCVPHSSRGGRSVHAVASPPLAASVNARAAAPFEPLIDIHVHAFSPQNFPPGLGATDLIPKMDAAGVRRAVLISAGYPLRDRAKVQTENDFVAGQVSAHPDRFSGICGVHPLDAFAGEELTRCAKELGLIGVKVHAGEQKLDLSQDVQRKAVGALIELAGELGVWVLIHAPADPTTMIAVAREHPKTRIVFAHAFMYAFRALGPLAFQRQMAREKRWQVPENLFVDVSAVLAFYADSPEAPSLVWYLRKFGMDHVLFGSDFPLFEPERAVAALRRYPFSPEELAQIGHENAGQLLARPAALPR